MHSDTYLVKITFKDDTIPTGMTLPTDPAYSQMETKMCDAVSQRNKNTILNVHCLSFEQILPNQEP